MAKDFRNKEQKNEEETRDDEFIENLVTINRTAKVVKGGSRFSFSALVVVGDGQGQGGVGLGKAKEVPESIRKASDKARKSMFRISIKDGHTLHHEAVGRYGAGKVVIRPASKGTGIIAGGAMRPIFEVFGIKNVLAKSIGTSNPHNMIKATLAALKSISSPETIAAKRRLPLDQVKVG